MTPAAGGEEPLAEDGLPTLSAVIRRHGLSARKALGQNFLLDLSLTRRIARAAAQPLGEVLEIGPGPGGLTRALLFEGAERVVAIERDPRCLDALEAIARHYPGRLKIVEGDALRLDPRAHLETPTPQIVANLPYNIGTELLVRWLRGDAPQNAEGSAWWRRATLMLQKEVAERVVAEPGVKAYGRISVLARWRAEARILFDVSPKAFTPPPKVVSSVLSLTPLPEPRFPAALNALERVTAAAFSQRRKMLRGSLKSVSADPEALLEAAKLEPTDRADAVSPEAYGRLAMALEEVARTERAQEPRAQAVGLKGGADSNLRPPILFRSFGRANGLVAARLACRRFQRQLRRGLILSALRAAATTGPGGALAVLRSALFAFRRAAHRPPTTSTTGAAFRGLDDAGIRILRFRADNGQALGDRRGFVAVLHRRGFRRRPIFGPASVLRAILLRPLLLLTLLVPSRLRRVENAQVMLRMLKKRLGHHPIAGSRLITRKRLIFFNNLLRRATDFAFGSRTFVNAVRRRAARLPSVLISGSVRLL